MKRHFLFITLIVATLLTAACGNSRRDEINQRKAALKHKQDSALVEAQQELALVDSALQAAIARYDLLQQQLREATHTDAQLKQLGVELTAARQHRDSLQIRFDVLCGKIKYIHRRQQPKQ